jgi:hypothetical protein
MNVRQSLEFVKVENVSTLQEAFVVNVHQDKPHGMEQLVLVKM